MHYRPEIDGLRSVAVLPVLLFHAGVASFSGGYVGVDVFFVISGFLITSIINEQMKAGQFSFLAFYERRARRILPALFMVMACTTVAAAYVMLPEEFSYFAKSVIATIFFGSNVWFWRRGGEYFADEIETEPLLHTWSLAVEEQFYILFPVLLLLLHRHVRSHIVAAIGAVVALSLVLSVTGVALRPVATFYLLPMRAWEMGVGSLLALGALPSLTSRRAREIVGAAGLGAIACAVFLYDPGTPFPGAAALLPVGGAAAVIWAGGSGRSAATDLLSRPIAVGIGKISYSLYLWHWPVIVLMKQAFAVDTLTPAFLAATIVLSFVLAIFSYRVVETPFRKRSSRRTIFWFSGIGGTAFVGIAAVVLTANGIPERFSAREARIAAASSDLIECPGTQMKSRYCKIGEQQADPTFALWGDSHAIAAAPALDLAARSKGLAGIAVTYYSCPPLLDVVRPERPGCKPANDQFIEFLDTNPSIRKVVMTARWPVWRSGERPPGESGEIARLVDNQTNDLDEKPQLLFDRSLEKTLNALNDRGLEIVILGDVPEIGWDVPKRLLAEERFSIELPALPTMIDVQQRQAGVNAMLRREASRVGGTFFDLSPSLCRPICLVSHAGRPLYIDNNHLTATAAREVLTPVVAPLLGPPTPSRPLTIH